MTPEIAERAARLSRPQLVRLIAACSRSLPYLPGAAPAAPPPALDLLEGLPEPRLRLLLQENLQAVAAAVLAMAAAGGEQTDWDPLFEAARRGAEEIGLNYRQVVFELHSLLPFWNGGPTRSGEGSSLEATAALRAELPSLLARHQVRVLLDAPCGDFFWGRHLDLGDVRYIGVDIVPDIIAVNREEWGGERREFHCADVACDDLPAADAILCRDCLFHFSVEDVRRTLANFKRSGARLLLTSTFPGLEANRPIPTGHFHPINLQRPPYDLGPPLELVRDAPLDKWLGVWRLSDVPG